jgi:hypothetical protein
VPDNQRFVASEIRRIVVQAGERAHVELSSQEVADLVSRPVANVLGATVHVKTGASMGDSTFTLGQEGLAVDVQVNRDSLLVRFDVDLSTAAGVFPPDVADWLVRPALVSIRVEPGPATAAFVAAPASLASGAPASLSVQVVDDQGRLVKRPYSVRFVDSEGRDLATWWVRRCTCRPSKRVTAPFRFALSWNSARRTHRSRHHCAWQCAATMRVPRERGAGSWLEAPVPVGSEWGLFRVPLDKLLRANYVVSFSRRACLVRVEGLEFMIGSE